MRRIAIPFIALIAAAAVVVPATADATCFDRLCAGAGKADMTPPIGTPMGGFFSRSVVSGAGAWSEQLQERGPDPNLYAKTFRQSEGIHTRMHARALVLQDPDGRRFAFASVENRGAPYELHQAVVQRLAEAGADIPAERVVFSSTHSHSAPSPLTPYGGYQIISADLFDPRLFAIAAEALTTAILQGVEALEPARAGVGTVDLVGASANRSLDAHLLNDDLAPDHDGTATSPHAIDPDVTVIRAEALDGRPIGAFYRFAAHGTSIGDSNNLFSGDNMGPAMRFCETALTARASDGPAPICAQANGSEGDISPRASDAEHFLPSAYARAEWTGRRVADAALAAWDAAEVSDDPGLDSRFTILIFRGQDGDPGQPTSPVPSVGIGGNFGDGVTLPVSLPGIGNKAPIGAAPGGYPQWVPLQLIRVGDTAFVSIPAEMTAQMGRRVEAAVLDAGDGLFARATVLGLANAYVSYVATPEEYEAGLYEGAWTLYGPQEGNLMRNELARLAAQMAAGVHGLEPVAPPLGSYLGFRETPPLPDDPALVGTIVADAPATVARGEIVSFSWVGGNPGVDARRGEPLVRLQRRDGDAWVTEATEDDSFSIVRTERDASTGPHRWTATFDLPLSVPLGGYRIEVSGRAAAPTGPLPYGVASRTFAVTPLDQIEASIEVTADRVRVDGSYPAPTGERYAMRARRAEGTATLFIVRSGEDARIVVAPLGVDVPASIQAGDAITLLELSDVWGNTGTTGQIVIA